MSFFKKHKRKLTKLPKAENINKEESSPKAEKENHKLVEDWENELAKSNDYKKTYYFNQKSGKKFTFTFIPTLVEEKILDNNALPNLLEDDFYQISDVKKLLPIADVEVSTNKDDIPMKLLQGYVLVTLEGDRSGFAFFSAQKAVVRSVSAPEIELVSSGQKRPLSSRLGKI